MLGLGTVHHFALKPGHPQGVELFLLLRRAMGTGVVLHIASFARQRQIRRWKGQLAQGNRGNHEVETAGRPKKAKRFAMGEHPEHRVLALLQELWQRLDQQGQGDLEGIHVGLDSHVHAQGLHELSDHEHHQDVLLDEDGVTAPPVMPSQWLFEGQKSEFHVPMTGIQPSDVGHGEQGRVKHMGERAAHLRAIGETQQAHQVTGACAMGGAEPEQSIEDAFVPREDLLELVGGFLASAADKPVLHLREVVKPGKAEVPQIEEDETAQRQAEP